VLALNENGRLRSAHDCAEGGLAVCLAESAIAAETRLGATVELADELDAAALLFGEAQGRIVVTCAPEQRAAVVEAAHRADVPAAVIGTVGGADGELRVRTRDAAIALPVASLHEVHSTAIPRLMERAAAE
jgi:phosphoribosylformylglycinamidine synthase